MNTPTRPTRAAPAPTSNLAPHQGPAQGSQMPAVQSSTGRLTPLGSTTMIVDSPPPKAYPPKIAKAILAVTRKIQPVEKAGWNDFHKYAYRKFEDVFNELVPLINEHGLIIQQSEVARGNFQESMISITYSFTIINEDGDVWPDRPEITAICKAKDSKGILDDKAASKCNTQAQKYFYVPFFKIRSVDTSEADHDTGEEGERRPARRSVPNPQGEHAPHLVEIVDGEPPQNWAIRFIDRLQHVKAPQEVDQWYAKNVRIFEKLKEKFPAIHDQLIDAMDARVVAVGATSGSAAATSDFPGDKPMKAAISDNDQTWLLSLEEAFAQCTNVQELASEQESMMLPSRDAVSDEVWSQAVAIVNRHTQRLQRG